MKEGTVPVPHYRPCAQERSNPKIILHPGYQCLIVLFPYRSVLVYQASHLFCGTCRNRWYDLFAILWQGPMQGLHRVTRRVFTVTIQHGDLHNILLLIGFSVLFATVLHLFGIRFTDALICSAVGIAAHFIEDALVYHPAYAFLWPITTQTFGYWDYGGNPQHFLDYQQHSSSHRYDSLFRSCAVTNAY